MCRVKGKPKENCAFFKIMAILLVLLCSFFTGCGQQKEETAAKTAAAAAKVIVVGIDSYPPFSFSDDNGKPMGIDIELAREAFGRMGYAVRFERIEWGKKKSLLSEGKIDCIWACFSMQGREQEYKWAGPYLVSRQVVAVTQESNIRSFADLENKIVAVRCATKAAEIFTSGEDPRIPKLAEVYSVENRDLLYAMLGKGYVDAIAGHISSIKQYNKDFTMNYRVLDEPLVITGVGVAFDKDDERGLDKELQRVLQDMREDGTIRKVAAKYLDDVDSYLEVDKVAK